MIISRTPFRVSFFGGGTDYPTWFREHAGAVLGTTINKYCYVSVRNLPPFFEHRWRIAYSAIEHVNTIEDIQHPAFRAVLAESGIDQGLEIHYDSDLPARSGLGSSSAFIVGLLNALSALKGQMVSKSQLGREAIRIEQDVLQEAVGCQDQLWAAYGGFNRIDFSQSGDFAVSPVIIDAERREEIRRSLMLCFTGFSRYADSIARDQIENQPRRTQQLHRMREMVEDGAAILTDRRRPISDLGELLHEGWCLKRELADSVSTGAIDDIYEAGRKAGAIGGKLLGAGGGGFMIFLAEPQKHRRIREALRGLVHVPVDFDQEGSKIALYLPDGL